MKTKFEILAVNPPQYRRHYSNEASQNSLIAQTICFPTHYDTRTEEISSVYLDRVPNSPTWTSLMKIGLVEGTKKIIRLIYKDDPKEAESICKRLFAIRLVYYFNLSSGYDTPRLDYLYYINNVVPQKLEVEDHTHTITANCCMDNSFWEGYK